MSLRKKVADLLQHFKRSGINWLMAAGAPQLCTFGFQITGGGTGTDAVVFANISVNGEQLPNMADTSYVVVLGNTVASADGYVDETSKTVAGFSLKNLASTKVNVVVMGRAAGMEPVN